MKTCGANRLPMPSKDLSPTEWFRATWQHIKGYEPCGKPATHLAYGGTKPLCAAHAENLRKALASEDTLGNILAGRARTEHEIDRMITRIDA